MLTGINDKVTEQFCPDTQCPVTLGSAVGALVDLGPPLGPRLHLEAQPTSNCHMRPSLRRATRITRADTTVPARLAATAEASASLL
jgi:hypothetical protein